MPTLPQQPQIQKKSLQINISSEEDVKAVIQQLPNIKKAYDLFADGANISSVEFCIAEGIRKKVESTLTGAINWCRTYVKSVAPFDGNVLFPLRHFQLPPGASPEPAPKKNRYLPDPIVTQTNSLNPQIKPLGKTPQPVPADKSSG